MPSLGPAEILVILVIALLVFGPNKMPEIARQLGRGMREFRRVQQHLSTELRDVVSEFDGSNDTAPAAATPPGGDPVPTLPPKAEVTGTAADSSAPDGTAPPDASIEPIAPNVATPGPDASPGPGTGAEIPRGQRVWLPPTPPDA